MKTSHAKNILITAGLTAFTLVGCNSPMQFSSSAQSSLSQDIPVVDDPVVTDPVDTTGPEQDDTADSATEVFQQVAQGGKVDILFIVDNSPSMQKEQAKLGARLQAFMSGVKNLDWQIGFTTTDVSNGKYGVKGSLVDLEGHPGVKILTPSFTDADQVFLKTVQRPEGKNCIFNCPSSNEQPLKASILSMQKHDTDNAGFYRDGADLAIIVLSDEDEMSTGTSSKATKPAAVVAAFQSIFGTSKKLSVYGIVIQPGDNACYEDQKSEGFQNASPGTFVSELAQLTKGMTGSICANDYSASLEEIGNSVRLLSDYFTLKSTPVAGSVSVQLSPAQDIAWTVEGNKLMFETAPADGTVIQVTYTPQ